MNGIANRSVAGDVLEGPGDLPGAGRGDAAGLVRRAAAVFFPATPRRLPGARVINIALRSLHLMACGLLLGGHAFGADPERLVPVLALAIASGSGLAGLDLFASCRWIYQAKGVLVIGKLGLLVAAATWWEHRVVFLLLVVLVGSVGSHMPARFRSWSAIHRREIQPTCSR